MNVTCKYHKIIYKIASKRTTEESINKELILYFIHDLLREFCSTSPRFCIERNFLKIFNGRFKIFWHFVFLRNSERMYCVITIQHLTLWWWCLSPGMVIYSKLWLLRASIAVVCTRGRSETWDEVFGREKWMKFNDFACN